MRQREQGHAPTNAAPVVQAETGRPTLIRLTTIIGYGSPGMQGTPGVHGAALGADEGQATRDALEWKYGEFEIPDEVRPRSVSLAGLAVAAHRHVRCVPVLIYAVTGKTCEACVRRLVSH